MGGGGGFEEKIWDPEFFFSLIRNTSDPGINILSRGYLIRG